jgi:hypothetical protein
LRESIEFAAGLPVIVVTSRLGNDVWFDQDVRRCIQKKIYWTAPFDRRAGTICPEEDRRQRVAKSQESTTSRLACRWRGQ